METANSIHEGAVGDREIVISRTVKAARSLVWAVYTQVDHLDRWWGPDGFTNKTLSLDLRVGGQWKYTMTAADGTVFPNLITYTEITPIDRLGYEHGDWENPRMFFGTITFTDAEGGTMVTIRMILPTKEERDRTVEQYGAIEGGKQTLAKLDNYLRTLQNP
ncbi:MAG: SRPBCC domain-containing protein [Flavobacteriales bacterium]|nr:SRPBCC domain-containing protein [Flavobacteriales bacterium]